MSRRKANSNSHHLSLIDTKEKSALIRLEEYRSLGEPADTRSGEFLGSDKV